MDNGKENKIIYVASARVFCDGGPGSLGHPGVYLNIGNEPQINCPYCSRRFAKNENLLNGDAGGDTD